MAKAEQKYKGERDIEKLEEYHNYLMELKQQIELKGMSDDLKMKLILTLKAIWGPEGSCTKKYCEKLNSIPSGRTFGLITASASGRMTSYFSKAKESSCSPLIDDIAKSLKARISRLKSKNKK